MQGEHGGDVVGYTLKYGRAPVDFSASLNPLGMPPAVARAAKKAVGAALPYPDPHCRALAAALAGRLGLPEEQLIFGGGAAEVIDRFVRAAKPKRALLVVPTFSEYERALRAFGCRLAFCELDAQNGFLVDESLLEKITPGVDALFLCQPGNPTGRLIAPGLLVQVLARCAHTGTRLFVDESFLPLVPGGRRHSLLHCVEKHKNLFVLGSFTKLYGMAGIRLGFGVCSDEALLAAAALAGQPWPVSTVAQAAGLAALGQGAFVRRALVYIEKEKARLCGGLAALGIRPIGAAANYVFFFCPQPFLAPRLAEKGILIRDCANFRGLGPGYYRVAVRRNAENDRLLACLGALLRE